MYHSIKRDTHFSDPQGVSLLEFRRQLDLIEGVGYQPVTFQDIDLYARGLAQLPPRPIVLTFDDAYLDFYELAWPALHEKGWKATLYALGDFSIKTSYWESDSERNGNRLMDPRHLRELASVGVEIGSHSLSHCDLTRCSIHQAWKEIAQSKHNLEQLLGHEVLSFSFPFGKQNGAMSALASVAGYSFACGVYSGPGQFSTDRFNLRRLSIEKDVGPFGYLVRLRYPYNWLEYGYYRMIKPLKDAVTSQKNPSTNRIKRNEYSVYPEQRTEST